MKYNELVNKCIEVANAYNLQALKSDESEQADALRSQAAAKVREWFYSYKLQPVDKSKRKFAFEDRNEYLHTAFYLTGIYIKKTVKTRELHNVPTKKVSAKEWQKRQLEAEPIKEGTNFFIDLFRTKEANEKKAQKEAEAKEVLKDLLSTQNAEIEALKKELETLKKAQKLTAAKATKKAKKAN